jgi:hypothetical protein
MSFFEQVVQFNRPFIISFTFVNPPFRKQWLHSLEKKQHNDMGEWSKKNNMIYPPLEEGEPPRPHEIYWGRSRVAICRRVMARTW